MPNHFSQSAARLLLDGLDQSQLPFVTVRSDSMAPLLRRGDQIQLGPIGVERLIIGNIVVLGEPEELLAHRLWGVEQLGEDVFLLSRGDRLAYYDPLTPSSQLRAIVIARRRSGRLLRLDHGSGAWLNHRLTQLSHLDNRVMRLSPPTSTLEPGPVAHYGLTRRLVRRSLLVLAVLLTRLINLLPE